MRNGSIRFATPSNYGTNEGTTLKENCIFKPHETQFSSKAKGFLPCRNAITTQMTRCCIRFHLFPLRASKSSGLPITY